MKVTFVAPKEFIPPPAWVRAFTHRQRTPRGEKEGFGIPRSWIFQPWLLLMKEGVECEYTPYLPEEGITLMLSFNIHPDSQGSDKFFLVDIAADRLPRSVAHFHIVQNPVQAREYENAFYMPHWPEHYLIPRDENRKKTFANICYFGDPDNLAAELKSEEWQRHLKNELGLHFQLKHKEEWHDYSDVDAVVAIRDFSNKPYDNKPATKLYNAWLAGVPFIGGCDSAYASEGSPEQDYLVAAAPEELLQQLRRLKQDQELRARLVQRGSEVVQNFTMEKTLERWKKLIQEILPQRALEWHRTLLHKASS